MEQVKEKEAETTEECERARTKAKKSRQAFEKVKAERIKRFQEFFEPVSQKIDEIYKVRFLQARDVHQDDRPPPTGYV